MDNIIKLYSELRGIAERNGSKLAQELAISPNEAPLDFFAMVHNDITLTTELLIYYNRCRGSIKILPETEGIPKDENGERLVRIQKWAFISIMSSFEVTAKKIALKETSTFGAFKGRPYLKKIMQRSFDKGLISQENLHLWKGAIELRNLLVHNNGISEKTACYEYPEVTIQINSDRETQGSLISLGLLIKWLLNETKIWILDTRK